MDAMHGWILAAWLAAGGAWYVYASGRGLISPRWRGKRTYLAVALVGGLVMWCLFVAAKLLRRKD